MTTVAWIATAYIFFLAVVPWLWARALPPRENNSRIAKRDETGY